MFRPRRGRNLSGVRGTLGRVRTQHDGQRRDYRPDDQDRQGLVDRRRFFLSRARAIAAARGNAGGAGIGYPPGAARLELNRCRPVSAVPLVVRGALMRPLVPAEPPSPLPLTSSGSRRQFLSTAAAASAGLLASCTMADDAAAVPRPRSNRGRIYKADKGGRIGGNQAEMAAKLQQYKDLGFDGLEGGSPDIPDIAALNAAIREVGFPVHGVVDGVHWKERLSSPDEAVREKGRLALEQALRDSHAIGGSTVLLVPGRVTGEDENHDHVWQRSIVEIRKVLPLAARLGIRILIENVWNGFCEDPQQLRDYIDEINSAWVGVYFDIGNCRKFGPAEDWIRTLGTRIVKLDMKDWGQANGFCRLGEGDVNWPEVRRALAEFQFTGWATREGGDRDLADTSALMDELLDL